MRDLASALGLEIDGDAALVAVRAEKHSSEARRGKRRPSPGFVALPLHLDLDDLRAEVAEILAAQRPRQNLGEIQHLDSRERLRHGHVLDRPHDKLIRWLTWSVNRTSGNA